MRITNFETLATMKLPPYNEAYIQILYKMYIDIILHYNNRLMAQWLRQVSKYTKNWWKNQVFLRSISEWKKKKKKHEQNNKNKSKAVIEWKIQGKSFFFKIFDILTFTPKRYYTSLFHPIKCAFRFFHIIYTYIETQSIDSGNIKRKILQKIKMKEWDKIIDEKLIELSLHILFGILLFNYFCHRFFFSSFL